MTQQHETSSKKIQNPLVLILGISHYSSKSRCRSLPPVKKDIENLERLFLLEFGYNKKYVWICKSLKNLVSKTIEKAQKTLDRHKKNKPFDAFIFIYSGHGHKGRMIGKDGLQVPFSQVHAAFSNTKLPFMTGLPRIYIQDCCRGLNKEKVIKISKSIGYTNSHDDRFIWRSSSSYCTSYATRKGSAFIYAICEIFSSKIKNEVIHKYNFNRLISMVYNKVKNDEKGEQTPELTTQSGYDVYFITSKQSPYHPKAQETTYLYVEIGRNSKFSDQPPYKNQNSYQNSQNNGQKSKRCEDVLRIMKLDKYIQDFIDEGFESTDTWKKLDDKILRDDIGMKKKDRQVFLKMLKNLKMLKKL